MPLWAPYDEDIRSPIADLDNAPGGGMAGSITAALFLRRFVEGAGAWAHMDIYGWTPKAKPGRPKGGEPQGARAAFALIEARHG
jgi:leucyl aminopeptidase